MEQQKYTEAYLNYLIEFSNAQDAFNANPNKQTATALSNLRAKKFSEEEKYLKEYIKEHNSAGAKRLLNYANSINIEQKFEKGLISNDARMEAHIKNDQQNPLK